MSVTMSREAAMSWSTISLAPLLCKDTKSGMFIVYWQGLVMSQKIAIAIAAKQAAKVAMTQKMRQHAWEDHALAYHVGAFGDVEWNISAWTANDFFKYINDTFKSTKKDDPWELYKQLNDTQNCVVIQEDNESIDIGSF